VNSDDPAYFGGYINQSFVETFVAKPSLGPRAAYTLAHNSFLASFVSGEQKAAWITALDAQVMTVAAK